ncbi:MAG TPA: enoyl-CoA hydratase/isomerase family protein [Thermoanaerobaculia bacterium]|nr:enoyl-CoA hydratase/isomerase family protein [Thermoanaerobaculia bacterium]
MQNPSPIELETRGDVTLLRLAHGRVNALDLELVRAFDAALDEVEEAGAVVLTGRGSVFSAGVDLARVDADPPEGLATFLVELDALFRRLLLFSRPVVAANNGHALAGGWVLACACDVRLVAAGEARLGVTELAVGVPFPRSAFEAFRLATPAPLVASLALRARRLTVAEAAAHGLLDEVLSPEDLLPRAFEIAAEMAPMPSSAIAVTKRQLRAGGLGSAEEDAAETFRHWNAPEARQRIRTFLASLAARPRG